MIERQIERLSLEEQRVLTAASVAGMEFPAAMVAAALGIDVAQVEEWCETLMRFHRFLQSNRTYVGLERRQAARYHFLHSLYLSLAYERLPLALRRQLHRRIGEWKEVTYGKRANEIAAELAVHYEQGQDYRRAVHYSGERRSMQYAGMHAQGPSRISIEGCTS